MITKRPTLLYEELRLIEKKESEVSSSWKSAHVLLFFLAFVFGSFCTFCFHMLMYMFDEKCVLFPKLLSVSSQRQSKLYEYLPLEQEVLHTLPVDFLSTQWVEQSTCYLPTYLPLISGIFGLVWITMFVMCSSGGYQTGLQSPWRALLPLFVFSVLFGSLCMYTSVLTHTGLSEFCDKLSEATNIQSCSYTINVVTLVYTRRISGVYQATRLTIMSAWVHTACWLLSAALVALRVMLAVDFQLVRVRAVLYADVDVMLQRNEKQMHIVLPESRTYSEIRRTDDNLHRTFSEAGTFQLFQEKDSFSPLSETKRESEQKYISILDKSHSEFAQQTGVQIAKDSETKSVQITELEKNITVSEPIKSSNQENFQLEENTEIIKDKFHPLYSANNSEDREIAAKIAFYENIHMDESIPDENTSSSDNEKGEEVATTSKNNDNDIYMPEKHVHIDSILKLSKGTTTSENKAVQVNAYQPEVMLPIENEYNESFITSLLQELLQSIWPK